MAFREQFIENAQGRFRISRGPSIFTNRAGKEDCYIQRRSPDSSGALQSDGNLYHGIARIACESGDFLRSNHLPGEIDYPALVAAGFVDGEAVKA